MKAFARRVGPLVPIAVAAVVFVSRLPFIKSGYGRDPDAWRIVSAARSIAETGQYHVSRFPGYPVPELAYGLLYRSSDRLLPVAVLLSALSAGLFCLIVRRYGGRDPVCAGLAIAFTPVVFINSTNTMDYVWALTFALGAFYLMLRKAHLWAGILLGLAIGCRMTSAVLVLPFSLMLVATGAGRRSVLLDMARLWLPAFGVAAAAYLPVFARYGSDMFTFYDQAHELNQMVHLAGEGVWGTLGLGALALAAAGFVNYVKRHPKPPTTIPGTIANRHIAVWATVVILYVIMFIRLPAESGYLIIIVPFVVLLLARYVPRRIFVMVTLLLIASPFVDIRPSGVRAGPIFQDRHARRVFLRDSGIILGAVERLDGNPVTVVAGWMAPQLETIREVVYPNSTKTVVFARTLTEEMLRSGQDTYVLPVTKVYPDEAVLQIWIDAGARVLPVSAP